MHTKFKREIEEEEELKLKHYNLGVRELLNDIKTAFYERVRALKDLPLAEHRKQASYWRVRRPVRSRRYTWERRCRELYITCSYYT